MSNPTSPIGPSFTVSSGGYGSRVLPFLGQIDLVFDVSPVQFDFSGGQTPRFFGGEGTGCFYGLGGCFDSWLVWGNFLGTANVNCYQFSGFTVNPLGIFNNNFLLPDPNIYGTLPGSFVGCFSYPMNANATAGVGQCQVSQTRFGAQFQVMLGNAIEFNQQIRFPNVTFQPTSGKLQTSSPYHLMASNSPYGGLSTDIGYSTFPFVVEDDFGNFLSSSYTVISWQYGTSFPPNSNTQSLTARITPWTTQVDSDSSFDQGAFEVAYLTKNGINCVVDNIARGPGTSPNSMKINPVNGNYFMIGQENYAPAGQTTGLYTGNVIVPAVFGSNYSTARRDYTTLEVPSDNEQILSLNSQLNYGFMVQQCSGGNFLCMNNSNGPFYLIKGDLSGYFRLMPNFNGNQPQLQYDTSFGMDYDGFIYMFDGAQTNPVVYSTLTPLPPVMLTIPQISLAGTSCRRMSCAPWEG